MAEAEKYFLIQGGLVWREPGDETTFCLPAGCLYQENLKFEIKKKDPHIRLGAGGLSINPIIPEIIYFQTFIFEPFTLRFKRAEK